MNLLEHHGPEIAEHEAQHCYDDAIRDLWTRVIESALKDMVFVRSHTNYDGAPKHIKDRLNAIYETPPPTTSSKETGSRKSVPTCNSTPTCCGRGSELSERIDPMPKPISPEKQLAIARLSVDGVKLGDIRCEVGVGAKSVSRYRKMTFAGIKTQGIELRCECGRDLGHGGHCPLKRAPAPDNQVITDVHLLDALEAGLAAPERCKSKPSKLTGEEQRTQELGRCSGLGESVGSIQTRQHLGPYMFDQMRERYPRAWALGVKQGKEQLAGARARRKLATGAETAKPVQRKPAPAKAKPDVQKKAVPPEHYVPPLPAVSTGFPWGEFLEELEDRAMSMELKAVELRDTISAVKRLQQEYP